MLIVDPDVAEAVAISICDRFDELAPSFYDDDDARAGSIEVADRRGVAQRYGLLSLSIGIASSSLREFAHQGEAVAAATEMKRYAKSRGHGGSNYAFDRRSEDEDGIEIEVDLP